MSDHEEILQLIQTTHNDLKDIIKSEVGSVTQRLDKLNGNVAELWQESNRRQRAVDDFRRLESSLLGLRKKWFYIAMGAIVFILAVVVVYDLIGIRGIIELVK